jgi:hypothetical protein
MICSNSAGGDAVITSLAGDGSNARTPASAWARKMMHGTANYLFKLALGFSNFPIKIGIG